MFGRTYEYLYSFFTNGDTDLHQIIRQAKTLQEIQLFINNQSPIKLKKMAQTVNHYGALPIELIESSKLTPEDKILLEEELLKFNLDSNYLGLQKEMTSNNVVVSGFYATRHKTNEILTDLLSAANVIRKCLKFSNEHPDANHYTSDVHKKIYSDLLKQEQKLSRQKTLFQNTIDSDPKLSAFSQSIDYERLFTNFVLKPIGSQVLNERKGNCFAFAVLMYCKIRKKHPELPMTIISSKNGKRTFLVIIEDKDKEHCDPNNWYMICDTFSGKFLMGHKKLENLKLLKTYHSLTNKVYRCQVNYNEFYHSFEELIPTSPFKKNAANQLESLPPCSLKRMGIYLGAGICFYAAYKLASWQYTSDESTDNHLHFRN